MLPEFVDIICAVQNRRSVNDVTSIKKKYVKLHPKVKKNKISHMAQTYYTNLPLNKGPQKKISEHGGTAKARKERPC